MSKAPHDSEPLNGRYRVLERIARGAQGSTSKAVDEQTDATVVLKELDFAGVGDWDEVALFERESAVLAGLDNPAIPRFLDAFQIDDEDGSLRMFLVQEFVEGEDLQVRLDAGGLFDEARLLEIAEDVLETLAYLHGHSPPVIHRDVKPANLIARPNGSIAVVDFGAAQWGQTHGTAVIGTSGYMPAEQLMGRALPVSDLFALGATLIHLATRKHPSHLGDGLGLNWRDKANLTPRVEEWLDRLVAPMPEDRLLSAVSAQRALENLGRSRREAKAVKAGNHLVRQEVAEDLVARTSSASVFDVRVTGSKISLARLRKSNSLATMTVLYIMIGLFFSAISHVVVGLILVLPFLFFARGHSKKIKNLSGHSRGLDLVWVGKDEVVQRVGLDEIAGVEVIGTQIQTLLLWRRDGSSIVLEKTLGHGDFEEARAAIHQWLVHVRGHG